MDAPGGVPLPGVRFPLPGYLCVSRLPSCGVLTPYEAAAAQRRGVSHWLLLGRETTVARSVPQTQAVSLLRPVLGRLLL